MNNLFNYILLLNTSILPIRYDSEYGFYIMAEQLSGIDKIDEFWTFFDGNVKEIYKRFGNTVTVKRNSIFHKWTWCDAFGLYLYNYNFKYE